MATARASQLLPSATGFSGSIVCTFRKSPISNGARVRVTEKLYIWVCDAVHTLWIALYMPHPPGAWGRGQLGLGAAVSVIVAQRIGVGGHGNLDLDALHRGGTVVFFVFLTPRDRDRDPPAFSSVRLS